MKKSSVITLILAGVLLTNCVSCLNDKKNDQDDKPEETEETTVETSATPTPTEEPTPTPTPEPTAEPEPSEITAPDDLTADDLYQLYRQYAEELNSQEEGLLYGYHFTRLAAGVDQFWVLAVVYPDGTFGDFVSVDGVMTDISNDVTTNCTLDAMLPYDDFMKLPYLAENFYLSDAEIVDTIEDGRYFGNVYAFTEDGRYMFAIVGDPVTVTPEKYEALEVGDLICTGPSGVDFVVTDITYNDDGSVKKVRVNDHCWFLNDKLTLGDTYHLISGESDPVYINYRAVVIPVADDCGIDDQFAYYIPDGYDAYVEGLEDPNVITSSAFWYQQLLNAEDDPDYKDYGNGWMRSYALLYPIDIRNGQAVGMSLQS